MRLFVRSLLFTLLAITLNSVNAFSQTATIKTDQLDYPPGSTVIITGTGWQPGETVTLQVLHEGETGDNATSGAHMPFTAVADGGGNVSSTWIVPYDEDELGATLLLTAIGANSGLTASWTFTDALPDISANPSSGSSAGGYTVTLTASSPSAFNTGGAPYSVTIDGVPVFPIVVESAKVITFTAPAHTPGNVSIVVNGKNGPATNATNFTYGKADQTITFNNPGTKTYGDADFDLGATSSSGLPVTYSISSGPATIVSGNMLHITGAGVVTVVASQTGNDTYAAAVDVTQTFIVNKADATVSVSGYTGTYDAQPHGASGTATGVGGVDLSSGLSLGSTFTNVPGGTANWSFSGGTNYKDQSGTVSIVINKADATVSVSGYTGTYDAQPHGASGTATGVGGVDLSSGLNFGSTFTDVPGGVANWSFSGGTNYKDQSGTVSIVINKADADVSVSGYTGTYDAQPHGASGTATGVGGVDLSSGLNFGSTFTDVPGGTANWTFSGGTNYKDQSGTVSIVINKADADVSVSGYTGTYDAQPHGASGTATGVGGVDLSSGLSLGSTFTDVPGGVANWSFSGGTNYKDQSGTVSIVINKADADVSVSGYTGTYDAQPHGASGTATGVGGVDLSSGLNFGSTFTDVPGGTANWTFSGGTNYKDQSGTVNIVINKADADVSVSGYTGTYDAQPHGASGTATGVGGVDLSSGLSLGSTFTNVPGGTANWSFSGGTNYKDQSGTVSIVINKADATVSVSGYTGTYDAQPHGASGTATGVGGVDLSSGLNFGSTFTDVPGGVANWSFSGGTNYKDQSGTVSIVINKADADVSVSGYTGTYDAQPHGASGTATGVGGVDLSSGLNFGSTFTDVPGGTANWTFSGGTNYKDQSGTVSIVINKADADVSVSGYTGTYDAQPHGASGTATGVGGVDLSSGLNFGSTFTDVPGGVANWSFSGGTNYKDQSGTVSIVINKADADVSVSGYTGTYDAQPHGASGTATGVGGVDLSSGLNFGSTFTDVPGGTANWTFSGGTNYKDQSGTVSIVINKANQSITWSNPSDIVYGTLLSATQLNATVAGVTGGSATGTVTYTPAAGTLLNAGASQTLHVDVAATDNYNAASKDVTINVNKRPITITPDAGQFKYCGQPDPSFTYTASEDLIPGNSFSGSLSRSGSNDVGTYSYTLGTLSAGTNYALTLSGSNTFEIKGVSIDASNTSTAIQLGTTSKTLTATVTSGATPVPNATVTFTVTNNGNITPITVTAVTDANGVATYSLPSASLAVGLYQVTAIAGSGCAQSVAYFSVYDPNAGFVTGGGWINSPAGAYSADPTLSGKANFGFNAQYKKGNQTPEGNTEFQFQAGNLNFKSTDYGTGSLVIAGAKAIFQGTGTINGTGSYNFMISAIDGSISGGGGVDKFRIKIWTNTDGSGVVYDNNQTASNNADPTTALGGGSIVIHSSGNNKTRVMDTVSTSSNVSVVNQSLSNDLEGKGKLSIKVMPNPTSYYFNLSMKSQSKENVKMTVLDVTGRVIEQRTDIPANSTFQLGNSYHPGIYIAQFMQGNDTVTLRLIKEGK